MFKLSMLAAAIAAVLSATYCLPAAAEPAPAPRKTLTAFANDQELADTLKRWAEEARRRRDAAASRAEATTGTLANQQAAQAVAPAVADKVAGAAESDSVTNVQHAGVA